MSCAAAPNRLVLKCALLRLSLLCACTVNALSNNVSSSQCTTKRVLPRCFGAFNTAPLLAPRLPRRLSTPIAAFARLYLNMRCMCRNLASNCLLRLWCMRRRQTMARRLPSTTVQRRQAMASRNTVHHMASSSSSTVLSRRHRNTVSKQVSHSFLTRERRA